MRIIRGSGFLCKYWQSESSSQERKAHLDVYAFWRESLATGVLAAEREKSGIEVLVVLLEKMVRVVLAAWLESLLN